MTVQAIKLMPFEDVVERLAQEARSLGFAVIERGGHKVVVAAIDGDQAVMLDLHFMAKSLQEGIPNG